MKPPLKLAVTGATGNVAYGFIFRAVSGELFGPDQPVELHLHDLDQMLPRAEGVVMELEDCAFPLLHDVVVTSDYKSAFDGVSWAVLIGSVPRKEGMERGDLLTANGGIFGPVGQAINDGASEDVRIIVVGNPCNTNALIARSHAPDVPGDRWLAMTRLDQNRAESLLASKAGAQVADVANLCIWGNHSATQYPDAANATINGKPAPDVIGDDAWLSGEFIEKVQKRGAAVIAARGASSAASAANGAFDSIRALLEPTPKGDCFSNGVVSNGEYGIPEGLVFSFPLRSKGKRDWSVIEGFKHTPEAQARIDATAAELVSEKEAVKDLLGLASGR
ncbi:MAG: malate dehydrogenase [Actinobacteria bacterium]|nr:malate dehydrogenase [Actinomycetota bacterium]